MQARSLSEQVVIAGGGVAGLAAAATLSRAGLPVILLEAAHIGGRASTLNQGWLHSGGIFARKDPALARLCWQSLQQTVKYYPQCLEPHHDGMFYIASRTETLTAPWTSAWSNVGIPFSEVGRARVLQEVRGIDPARIKKVFLLPDRAFQPHLLLEELAATARNAGCELRTGTRVAELLIEDNRVRGVKTASGEMIAARHVILATGAAIDPALVPDQGHGGGTQPELETVALKTHLVAIRPDVTHMPFVFLDWHQLNHIPHLQTSVFQSGEWTVSPVAEEPRIEVEKMEQLRQDIQHLFPGMKFNEFSDVREWAGTTTQGMQVDQIRPGEAPRPSVVDHSATGGPANLWSISTGRMTLWPIIAEEIRQRLLSINRRGEIKACRPPWDLAGFPGKIRGPEDQSPESIL